MFRLLEGINKVAAESTGSPENRARTAPRLLTLPFCFFLLVSQSPCVRVFRPWFLSSVTVDPIGSMEHICQQPIVHIQGECGQEGNAEKRNRIDDNGDLNRS